MKTRHITDFEGPLMFVIKNVLFYVNMREVFYTVNLFSFFTSYHWSIVKFIFRTPRCIHDDVISNKTTSITG